MSFEDGYKKSLAENVYGFLKISSSESKFSVSTQKKFYFVPHKESVMYLLKARRFFCKFSDIIDAMMLLEFASCILLFFPIWVLPRTVLEDFQAANNLGKKYDVRTVWKVVTQCDQKTFVPSGLAVVAKSTLATSSAF